MTTLPAPGSTSRTRVKRIPEKAVTDREVAYAILDAGLMAHVAVVTEGQPYVVPVGYARLGDDVVFHGSSASRLFKTLAQGGPTCLTVTLLDGLVLARSLFESSMHYRCVMALGRCRRLEGDEELAALLDLSERLMPGRTSEARHPTAQELKATITLALPLDEISVKVGEGPPEDVDSDLVDPVYSRIWAGSVPIVESLGEPQADELAFDIPVPTYVREWRR
jgi:nitroimidazol reductase NimA-like FMN-containing flavoprotein (pyridoxamine 5'-phosphate oxidase superfamily)